MTGRAAVAGPETDQCLLGPDRCLGDHGAVVDGLQIVPVRRPRPHPPLSRQVQADDFSYWISTDSYRDGLRVVAGIHALQQT
jgi:hypothetical protein